MATNEFERDLEDQAGLKRPGRVDLRVFQNTADAGDGHPGVQRCFRNYLHEGGMEKDLQLIGYGIKGTSVDLTNSKLQEFNHIEATTITAAQWGYVGGADQPVKQADSPTFNGLTLTSLTVNGAITITGNVDGVDVSDLKTAFDALDYYTQAQVNAAVATKDTKEEAHAYVEATALTMENDIIFNAGQAFDGVDVGDLKTAFDTHKASSGVDHTYINQDLRTTFSPTFVGLTLSADLVTTSTVDSVDIQNHTHGGANQGGTVDHVNLSNKGSNTHSVIDTHLGDYRKHDNIQPFHSYYTGGFTDGGDFGAIRNIVCSDTSADVYLSFAVQDIGTYRLHHASYCSADGGVSDKAGGKVYIGVISAGNLMTWNVADNQNWDLTQSQYQPRWYHMEYLTNIVVSVNDSVVYVHWHKDDNMSGRSGNWNIIGWWLERTA